MDKIKFPSVAEYVVAMPKPKRVMPVAKFARTDVNAIPTLSKHTGVTLFTEEYTCERR